MVKREEKEKIMKKLDLFAIGIGVINVGLFYQFVMIAEGVLGFNYLLQKRTLSFILSIFLAGSVSYLLLNLHTLLSCIETDDENSYKKIIITVGRRTIMLLSLFLITTMLQKFFLIN